MAIQNFLSGGYYGKLGATVGQRWKNKRTIRTYVVPANPRTPTQQANRGRFADAVTYAQMGMQMNYYCTLFDDPNFTKWNYRMKVARELKNAGLSGLDLIPLYPTSFNPPILLTEFAKSTVTGQKHISFAAPDLTLNTDRVLSLMFALYDEQDTFLGYKLYLGYYYASNPGYVEVDVDDVNEINTHCFVRVISNDDEDSSTELIGSPRLAVGGSTIDIHTFDKTIRSVQKSTTGITITFAEPWKGVPTVNEIFFDLACVVNGESVTLDGETFTLFENNGYCAVTFPYAGEENQMLPAFPSGSGIQNLTVDYEGASWQITIENANEAYSDSDLARSFISTVSSISRSGTTFSVVFGETLPAVTSRNLTLAIRAVKNGAWVTENVAIASIADDTITFEQSGAFGADIYAFPSGATITLAGTITGNGVTYTADTQTAQSVSNADLSRQFNSAISSISRSGTTFTVGLAAALPNITSRNLTLAVRAVKNGAWVNENVTIASASGSSITLEQSGASGANIYAFPSGATVTLAGTITGNGVTYTADTQTAQSVSNADLSRSILSAPTWDASSTGDIAFTIPFGGTVASGSQSMQMICSGRFDDRSAVAQSFSYEGDGSNLTFICIGDLKKYPMSASGDKITVPAMQFVCNGVTYTLASQDVNLRNAITSSYWLRSDRLTRYYNRDGGSSVGDALISLNIQFEGIVMDTAPSYSSTWIARINTVNGHFLIPAYCQMDLDTYDPTDPILVISADFDGQNYNEDVNTSCTVVPVALSNEFIYKGITYYFPVWPQTVGGWSV